MSTTSTFPGNEGSLKYDKCLQPVFPSSEVTAWGTSEADYPGKAAHSFKFQNSRGFSNGQAEYDESFQELQFVQKLNDGTIIPGVQSEQLLTALIERHEAMNERFPSEQGAMFIDLLKKANLLLEQRVRERMDRGVMGQLKQ